MNDEELVLDDAEETPAFLQDETNSEELSLEAPYL